MNIEYPQFAVVGHPNKGKSSIVSVLAMDGSVQISSEPGSTNKKRSFPFKIDNKIIYELIDTPGFQRGRRILAWLEGHEVSADKRPQIVQKFINEHKEDERYSDEIELLEPLMSGAGIIYVVDGSKPYGKEYEADMTILKWTGQPSMALINHIDTTDYTEEWKLALSQFFSLVRTFNPMKISMKQHLSLLESMAQLNEDWTKDVKESVVIFEQYHKDKISKSSKIISKLIYDVISLVVEITFKEKTPSQEKKDKIQILYKDKLRNFEKKAQEEIEILWNHKGITKEKKGEIFDELDLFSEASASIFGLTRKELAMRGAMAGAGIDLLSFGTTLFFGTLMGGLSAYFGFEKLSEVKVLGQNIGKKMIQIGPMTNINFPYLVLARAIYHTSEIATFSHAKKEHKIESMQENFTNKWLRDDLKNDFNIYHKGFVLTDENRENYTILVNDILTRLI